MGKNISRKQRRASQRGGAFNPDGRIYFNCFTQHPRGHYVDTPINSVISFAENATVDNIIATIRDTNFGTLPDGRPIARKFIFLMKRSPDHPENPHGICRFRRPGAGAGFSDFITMRSNGAGGIDIINQRNPPRNWFNPGGAAVTIWSGSGYTLVEDRVPPAAREPAREPARESGGESAAMRTQAEALARIARQQEETRRQREEANRRAAEARAEEARLAEARAAEARQRAANEAAGILRDVLGEQINDGDIMGRLRLTSGESCYTKWAHFKDVLLQCQGEGIPIPPANSIEIYRASVQDPGGFSIPGTDVDGPFMFATNPEWSQQALQRLEFDPEVLFAGLSRFGNRLRPDTVMRSARRALAGL